MQRFALIVLITLVLAGCQDQREVTGPNDIQGPFAPQFSVVVFGITDIGAPLGGDQGKAHAVNDLGEVVGHSATSTAPFIAFHWVNGAVRNLGTLTGDPTSAARDVNGRGQIVGVSDLLGSPQAVLWENGTADPLPTVSVSPFEVVESQEANAVNELGEIVGSARVRREFDVITIALYWANKSTAPAILGDLGGNGAVGRDINNRGEIVGLTLDGFGHSQPAFWASKDAVPDPLQPGSSSFGSAHAINELGQIAGEAGFGPRPVVWLSKDAIATPLDGSQPRQGQALDINELGQVVGWADTDGQTAALWLPEPTAPASYTRYNLGALPGADPSVARSVNNAGEVVGFSSFGQRATLWRIPIHVNVEATPAPIRLDGKGRVTVAILTSPYFNAANVDPSSLTLGNDDGLDTPIARKKKLTPAAKLYDVDRDGDTDLVAEFEESQLMANGDLTPATTKLALLGRLQNGKHIRGSDAVTVQ